MNYALPITHLITRYKTDLIFELKGNGIKPAQLQIHYTDQWIHLIKRHNQRLSFIQSMSDGRGVMNPFKFDDEPSKCVGFPHRDLNNTQLRVAIVVVATFDIVILEVEPNRM